MLRTLKKAAWPGLLTFMLVSAWNVAAAAEDNTDHSYHSNYRWAENNSTAQEPQPVPVAPREAAPRPEPPKPPSGGDTSIYRWHGGETGSFGK